MGPQRGAGVLRCWTLSALTVRGPSLGLGFSMCSARTSPGKHGPSAGDVSSIWQNTVPVASDKHDSSRVCLSPQRPQPLRCLSPPAPHHQTRGLQEQRLAEGSWAGTPGLGHSVCFQLCDYPLRSWLPVPPPPRPEVGLASPSPCSLASARLSHQVEQGSRALVLQKRFPVSGGGGAPSRWWNQARRTQEDQEDPAHPPGPRVNASSRPCPRISPDCPPTLAFGVTPHDISSGCEALGRGWCPHTMTRALSGAGEQLTQGEPGGLEFQAPFSHSLL